jgi:predicted kinase
MGERFVLLVTGHPGAGKSTLGPRIADELDAVCISRDAIHQSVFDGWEPHHPATKSQYDLVVNGSTFSEGKVNWGLFLWMIETVSRRVGVVAESPFNSQLVRDRFLAVSAHWGVPVAEVALVGEPGALMERVRARAMAADAHVIKARFTVDGAERLLEHPYVPVLDPARVVHVDTTDLGAVDVPAVARAARALLR